MTGSLQVAVIGAGPYGLSLAAHLQACGVRFRIFGSPMQSWREHMPAGMFLKSEGFASNLYDPGGHFTLQRFCAEQGLPYADVGLPIPLDTFTAYGLAFQKRLVPTLENRLVTALDRSPDGFVLGFEDGEVAAARQVVVAVGVSHFGYVPPSLEHLPAELVSHSSDHARIDGFKGQEVVVVGGGSSALDLAALLNEAGAAVTLVARRSTLAFNPRIMANPPLWKRLRYPISGIGSGLRNRFYTDAPILFHHLPEKLRLQTVSSFLGPAGGWYIKDRIVGRVPVMTGYTPKRAGSCGRRAHLQLIGRDGTQRELAADHVIAATGYKVNLERLSFLGRELRSALRSVEQTPVLSSNFQSSVPGLYFVGLSSANSFGPMMRFAFGAGYAAQRLSRHLSRASVP